MASKGPQNYCEYARKLAARHVRSTKRSRIAGAKKDDVFEPSVDCINGEGAPGEHEMFNRLLCPVQLDGGMVHSMVAHPRLLAIAHAIIPLDWLATANNFESHENFSHYSAVIVRPCDALWDLLNIDKADVPAEWLARDLMFILPPRGNELFVLCKTVKDAVRVFLSLPESRAICKLMRAYYDAEGFHVDYPYWEVVTRLGVRA